MCNLNSELRMVGALKALLMGLRRAFGTLHYGRKFTPGLIQGPHTVQSELGLLSLVRRVAVALASATATAVDRHLAGIGTYAGAAGGRGLGIRKMPVSAALGRFGQLPTPHAMEIPPIEARASEWIDHILHG